MKRQISLPLCLLVAVLLAAACGGSEVPPAGEGGAPVPAPTVGGPGSAAPAVSSTSAVPTAVSPSATGSSSPVTSTSSVAGGSSTSIVPTTTSAATPPVAITTAATTTIPVDTTSAVTTTSSAPEVPLGVDCPEGSVYSRELEGCEFAVTTTPEAPVGVSCSEGSAYSRDLEGCVEPPLPPENLRAQPGHEHLILYWSPGAFWPDPAPVEGWLVSLYDSDGSLMHESDASSEPVLDGHEDTIEAARKRDILFFLDYETPSGSEPMVPLRGGVVYRVGVRAVNAAGMSEEVFVESSPCVDCAPPPPTTTTIPVVEVVHEEGFVSVSAGWAYSCGLRLDGSVECWEWMADMLRQPDKGSGDGWSEDASTLTPPGGEFTMVDAGWEYACGLRPSGGVECWGRNPAAGVDPPEGEFTSVSVGIEHACALRPSEEVECWGRVWRGYRGHFARPPEGPFTAIAAGAMGSFAGFLCGLRSGGEVECWGRGYDEGEASPPSGEFKSISGGGGQDMCGLRRDGSVECWSHYSLQGEQEEWDVAYLRTPGGVFELVELGRAGSYTCGLRPGGEAECWDRHESVEMDGPPEGEKYIDLAVWRDFACGVRLDHTLSCWDQDAANNDRYVPGDGKYVEFENGISAFSCGVRLDGTIECSGGTRSYSDKTGWTEWKRLSDPSGVFTSVSVGSDYACGLRPDGEVECWGSDEFGKSTPPAGVFTQITTAGDYACGLRSDGEVECWGGSEFGWLLSKVTPPEERLVSVDAGWGGHEYRELGRDGGRGVSTGWGYSCGLREGGRPVCWGGELFGPIPSDTVRERHPILFPPEGQFLDVEAGRFRACGLRPSGEMECWGLFYVYNDERQLTPRVGSEVLNPDPAPGERFLDVDVGGWHVCGLRPDGGVECWDWTPGYRYRLDGLYEYELEGPYETISSGYRHACGLRRDGGVDCWGYKGHLQRLEEAPN